ncbi:hypothetical protein FA13DRAFT_1795389 [Coprinellus micaceus]|uniref:Uncharacterized protein n=1 Tax=Coprinellus micaceus TaxID=71717 RepID=A0A4Y7SYI0_COPMI|nr:hypothetical protein FA13DRAFT_1795389 [Coprinellus micaceus]
MRMTGISLIEHLDTLSNRPSGPALAGAGVPSPDVLSFLARIEASLYNRPLTSSEAVGDTITALRLVTAAIKTCKVAREMCRRHHISPTSFLSDMYLDRVVKTLWELVKDIPIWSRVVPQPKGESEGQAQTLEAVLLLVFELWEQTRFPYFWALYIYLAKRFYMGSEDDWIYLAALMLEESEGEPDQHLIPGRGLGHFHWHPFVMSSNRRRWGRGRRR